MIENYAPLVVIFDDDQDYAQTLMQNLLQINKRIQAVSSFDQFDNVDFSEAKCLILDFYLEETDAKYSHTALEVLTKIKKQYPSIKVILHSGQAENIDIIEADKLGIYKYIPKGDGSSRLIKNVQQLLSDDEIASIEAPLPNQDSEIERLNEIIEQLNNKLLADQDDEQSISDVKEAYKQFVEELQSIIHRISSIVTSGHRPGMLLDAILDDFIKHAGAQGGAWFLFTSSRERIRNQNCYLRRQVNVPRKPKEVLGSALWEKFIEQTDATRIVGPIDVTNTEGEGAGIFRGKIVLCVFDIKTYNDELLLVLEYSDQPGIATNAASGEYSAIKTYVMALSSMLDILPTFVSKSEFGKIDKITRFAEQQVSSGQIISRGFMSFLSLFLFIAAIISSIFAFIFLITSAFGFPNVLEKGFVWDPSHYGVGIVHALEVFILAITLYLLGIGLSCMIDHPRLSRVPMALRYLDNPTEMKKSLILAICTLLAVAGLKFILEFELPSNVSTSDWIKTVGIFGSKIIATILLILALTKLLGESSHQVLPRESE